jgi:peptidoglycan DL-endopeptidase CwlO
LPQHLPTIAARAAVATSTGVLAVGAMFSAGTPAVPAPAVVTQPVAPVVHMAPLPELSTPTTAKAITAAVTSAVAAVPAAPVGPSPAVRSATALAKAMSKIGSPYRWGAAGPSAFDCSGLVSWAYKQVGVSLPHSSNAMSRIGKAVSRSQLQPGDLVFFYQPVSHVAIYIGNGKVVHASTSSQPVKISNLSDMPFSGARRV